MSLSKKLSDIQSTLNAPKNLRNNFGNYNYRSCEGILETLKPYLLKHNLTLILTDEVKETSQLSFCEASAILSDGTDTVTVKAQAGIPLIKKGMDLSQIFGASSSYARKYALNGMFLIDDNKDSDSTNIDKGSSEVAEKKFEALNPGTKKWEMAEKFIKDGGSIDSILSKYDISVKNIKLLSS